MNFKKWVSIAAALFLIGAGIGLLAPSVFESLLLEQTRQLSQIGLDITPFTLGSFVYIFTRNTLSLVFSFALSPLILIAPVFSLVNNGLILAYVGELVAERTSVMFVVGGLLPHGIFEIPALIIGQAAALSFGFAAIKTVFRRGKKGNLGQSLRSNLKYLAIAVGLLFIAAGMETFVSPLFLSQ